MTDAITISKIQSLPKAEAKKVIDAIKSFSASTNTITHSSKKTLEIWQKYVDCMIFLGTNRFDNLEQEKRP